MVTWVIVGDRPQSRCWAQERGIDPRQALLIGDVRDLAGLGGVAGPDVRIVQLPSLWPEFDAIVIQDRLNVLAADGAQDVPADWHPDPDGPDPRIDAGIAPQRVVAVIEPPEDPDDCG